ncbi:MAG: PAS domain-containing sensor histidine kinase, partial [Candidatus Hodarchaeota archaeon]
LRKILWPPSWTGNIYYPEFMKSEVDFGEAPLLFIERGISHYAVNSQKDFMMTSKWRKARRGIPKRFVFRESIVSSAGILLKVGGEIVGILFINYRTQHNFDEDERRIIENYASYIALAIQNVLHFQEKEREQYKALQSERLAGMGLVAAITAHSARNRLTPIKLSVDQLAMASNEEEHKYLLNAINKNIIDLELQINTLLDLSKPIPLKKTQISFERAFNPMLEEMKMMAKGHEICFEAKVEENLPPLEIDRVKIEDVLWNLMHNSIEATPKGGRIKLKIVRKGEFITLSWEDTGKGISKELWDHMFEIPFSTKDKWGIGLVASKQIIKEHDGEIYIDTSIEKGARIIIDLPVKRFNQHY